MLFPLAFLRLPLPEQSKPNHSKKNITLPSSRGVITRCTRWTGRTREGAKQGGGMHETTGRCDLCLFDGENVDAFTKAWTVKDGVMIASPGATQTKQSFGSCTLHVEWRIPAGRKVNGQQGGNSGIFLMGRYEIQIQESHTNVTYADGQAAAIYGQTRPR